MSVDVLGTRHGRAFKSRASAVHTMSQSLAEPVPQPEWVPLPRSGSRGVELKVLLHQPALVLALLRFGLHATIDEHAADYPVDVICLEGAGLFSVDSTSAPLRAGERVRWPSALQHRLWTENSTMTTLMVEQLGERVAR
jgi:quercetin dioxygenase-like cupin family protein